MKHIGLILYFFFHFKHPAHDTSSNQSKQSLLFCNLQVFISGLWNWRKRKVNTDLWHMMTKFSASYRKRHRMYVKYLRSGDSNYIESCRSSLVLIVIWWNLEGCFGVGSFRPFYPFAPGRFALTSDPPLGRFAPQGGSFRPSRWVVSPSFN